MVEASVAAISARLSIAPRAMPSAFAADGVHRCTYQARWLNKAPVSCGGSSDRQVRRAGTNTSSTVKSWLPVPRMPITDHVSTIVTDSLGTHSARSNGAPPAVRRGVSPSIMMQVQYSQRALWMPLAKFHRPLTR